MPIYIVEQRGVPGKRLVEADKPQGAINHVISDAFTCRKVDGRELIDAFKECGDLEVAGGPILQPEPEPALTNGQPCGEQRVDNAVDPDDSKPIVEPDPDAARDLRAEPAFPPGEDEFGKLDD